MRPDAVIEPRPLTVLDKKLNRTITVTSLKPGLYEVSTDGPRDSSAGTVNGGWPVLYVWANFVDAPRQADARSPRRPPAGGGRLRVSATVADTASGPQAATQQADRAGSRSSSTSIGGSGDRVEFSGALGRLSKALSAFQSDRVSRVQALADQYRDGKYRVDSAATSHAMISDMLAAGSEAAS